jgi:hypothetical protein
MAETVVTETVVGEAVAIAVRDAAGSTIAEGSFDPAYARAIESLWRSARDATSRAAILRGLRPPLETARRIDPDHASLVIDGVELG